MRHSLSSLFASRYLFSRKSRSVINIIAGVSVVSVAAPVAAMVILLSIFNGFSSIVEGLCSKVDAAATVLPVEGQYMPSDEALLGRIASLGCVSSVSEVVEGGVAIHFAERSRVAVLRGVDSSFGDVVDLRGVMLRGSMSAVQRGDVIILGSGVSYDLGLGRNFDGRVEVYGIVDNSSLPFLGGVGFRRESLGVGGVFSVDAQSDSRYVFSSIDVARRLLSKQGRTSYLAVGFAAGVSAEQGSAAVRKVVGEEYKVQSIEERNALTYKLMKVEKWGLFFILLLVLIVASFAVVGAIAMLIIEKRSDFVTLRSLGCDVKFIRSIFYKEGALIALIGGGAGVVVGIALSLVQQHFGIIELPIDSLLVKSYPVKVELWDVVAVVGSFVAVSGAITYVTVRSMIKEI